jgi:hypothetical protein
MSEIEKRLDVINGFTNKEINALYLQTTIESEALQLRKILELIAYASLITHKEDYKKIQDNITRLWRAKNIINQIEKLNPEFYPIPTSGLKNGKWNTLRGKFLTKKQFEYLYDECGKILHAKNPFSKLPQKSIAFHKKVPEYVFRIEKLLCQHRVKLVGNNDEIHVIVPFHTNNQKVLRCLARRLE